jgi:hypothetical protein
LDALQIIGPAGRNVVSVDRFFSNPNPYVDYEARASARDRMFAALMNGDLASFEDLRRPFDVSHLLARGDEPRVIREPSLASGTILTLVFVAGTITIFEIATDA